MRRFEVDVSAFFAFRVEAPDAETAGAAAREFVRDVMIVTPDTIGGYNSGFKPGALVRIVPALVCPGVESADVEECEA
jgi:hypothetical protein